MQCVRRIAAALRLNGASMSAVSAAVPGHEVVHAICGPSVWPTPCFRYLLKQSCACAHVERPIERRRGQRRWQRWAETERVLQRCAPAGFLTSIIGVAPPLGNDVAVAGWLGSCQYGTEYRVEHLAVFKEGRPDVFVKQSASFDRAPGQSPSAPATRGHSRVGPRNPSRYGYAGLREWPELPRKYAERAICKRRVACSEDAPWRVWYRREHGIPCLGASKVPRIAQHSDTRCAVNVVQYVFHLHVDNRVSLAMHDDQVIHRRVQASKEPKQLQLRIFIHCRTQEWDALLYDMYWLRKRAGGEGGVRWSAGAKLSITHGESYRYWPCRQFKIAIARARLDYNSNLIVEPVRLKWCQIFRETFHHSCVDRRSPLMRCPHLLHECGRNLAAHGRLDGMFALRVHRWDNKRLKVAIDELECKHGLSIVILRCRRVDLSLPCIIQCQDGPDHHSIRERCERWVIGDAILAAVKEGKANRHFNVHRTREVVD
eukprot:scaffold127377_cov75-Phaeocystis_antarctica.AAC.2